MKSAGGVPVRRAPSNAIQSGGAAPLASRAVIVSASPSTSVKDMPGRSSAKAASSPTRRSPNVCTSLGASLTA